MRLSIKKLNVIAGILQLLINIIFIIPATLHILDTGEGGFGYGILLLSVTIPLIYMSVFAFFAFFNYEDHFKKIKKLLIIAYVLAIIICVLSFLWVPMVVYALTGIPIFIVLALGIIEENIGRRILFTNGMVLVGQLIIFLTGLN